MWPRIKKTNEPTTIRPATKITPMVIKRISDIKLSFLLHLRNLCASKMNMNHALTGPQMLIGSLPTLLPFETLHKLLQLEKALDLLIQLRIRPLFFLSKFLELNVICRHLQHLLRQLL